MSGPQTSTPGRPQGSTGAKQNALALVIPKWPDFVKKSKEGTLGAESEKSVCIDNELLQRSVLTRQIRSVITQQCKGAIYHGYLVHKINIFDNMHPALDPRIGHNGTGPQLSRERYETERLGALEELKTLQARKQAASAAGTATPTGSSPLIASSSVMPNQASSPASMSAPTPPAMAQAASSPNPSGAGSPRPLNAANPQAGARPPVRPTGLQPPEGIIALDEMRKILGIADSTARYAFLDKVCVVQAHNMTSSELPDNLRLQVFEQNLNFRSNSIKPEQQSRPNLIKVPPVDHQEDLISAQRPTLPPHRADHLPHRPARRHQPLSLTNRVSAPPLPQHQFPLGRGKHVRPIQQHSRVKSQTHILGSRQLRIPMRQILQTLFRIDLSI